MLLQKETVRFHCRKTKSQHKHFNFQLSQLSLIFVATYVDSIDFYMSEEYVEGVFNSCKNVITPSSGALAMDFACGRLGAKHCTAKKWVCFHQ